MDVGERRRRGPAPVVMTGPLARYESVLRVELGEAGYAASSVREATRAMARLSGWLLARGLAAVELTPRVVEEFLAIRRQRCSCPAARRWVGTVLRVLRGQGVVPSLDPADISVRQALLGDYRGWLAAERGLAAETVRCYGSQATKFLRQLPDPLVESLAGLDAAAVTVFVVGQSRTAGSVGSAKALVTALRSLLRFLHVEGLTTTALADAVPAVARPKLAGLPKALTGDRVAALLATCDRATVVGRRNLAVMTILSRLGLRAGEVARLRLDDIDWRRGEITVVGKGSRVERLPLPADVGQLIVAYLIDGRPDTSVREVFTTVDAPYRALTRGAVTNLVAAAGRKAGLGNVYAHRLRHSAATAMLDAGASLREIGEVLRHRDLVTTAIYAKVDVEALRTVARRWPGSEVAA